MKRTVFKQLCSFKVFNYSREKLLSFRPEKGGKVKTKYIVEAELSTISGYSKYA